MKAHIVGLLGVAVFGALVAPVRADPILVTSGSIDFTTGFVTLSGNGVSVTAGMVDRGTLFDLLCGPCAPARNQPGGVNTNVLVGPTGGRSGSPATFNGVSYPVAYVAGNLGLTVPTFFASELSPDHTTLTAPFSMTGSLVGFRSFEELQGYLNVGLTSGEIANDTITGSGMATAQFTVNPTPPRGSLFDPQSLTFQFQPSPPLTPEPTSLLLFGTGVGLVWRRVRA